MKGQVLLIIDVQVGLFLGPPFPHETAAVLGRINALVDRAHAAGVPVIFIQHDGTEEEGLTPESANWQIHPDVVRSMADLMIRKTASDAFFRSELGLQLARLGASELIVTGYATEFCVDTTVRRAVSEGFDVILASDAHTTKDRSVLEAHEIIKHHNWVLSNLIQPEHSVRVMPVKGIEF